MTVTTTSTYNVPVEIPLPFRASPTAKAYPAPPKMAPKPSRYINGGKGVRGMIEDATTVLVWTGASLDGSSNTHRFRPHSRLGYYEDDALGCV